MLPTTMLFGPSMPPVSPEYLRMTGEPLCAASCDGRCHTEFVAVWTSATLKFASVFAVGDERSIDERYRVGNHRFQRFSFRHEVNAKSTDYLFDECPTARADEAEGCVQVL